MIFNSIHFFIFLPIVLLVFYTLPHRFRWVFLLFASYVFYAGWRIEYLGLIVFSTLLDYYVGIRIYSSRSRFKRKLFLGLSICSNFGLLFLFKYFHFVIGGRNIFNDFALQHDSILWLQYIFEYGIPVGISFYTFQTVSYSIDVYNGKIEPEKNLGKFALFVSFFPQLVAGPIERFSAIHHQLFRKSFLTKKSIRNAFQLVLYGLFLKMVIADTIGILITDVFNSPLEFAFFDRWLAVVLFSFQIFADFFGYTLIAIGVAQLFSVKLQDNFNAPYGSYSIREFWSKWHISLSTWFRDYVYIPLGGSKNGMKKWIFAVFMTFGLSGLWHGASVNFIIWGLIHGVVYLVERFVYKKSVDTKTPFVVKAFRWTITFSVVCAAWVFFRAESLETAMNFFSSSSSSSSNLTIPALFLIPLSVFFILEFLFRKNRIDRYLSDKSNKTRWMLYTILMLLLLLFSSTGNTPFIYFQF